MIDMTTEPYVRILAHCKKTDCVRLEMERGITAWFPLCMVSLDQDNFEITAPDWMMKEKLSPAREETGGETQAPKAAPRSAQKTPPSRRRKTPHPRPRPKGMPWL